MHGINHDMSTSLSLKFSIASIPIVRLSDYPQNWSPCTYKFYNGNSKPLL
jgi:hypothetical protein